MLGLPLMGIISHRVDNRWLLFCGFMMVGVCSILFARINMGIGPTTMLVPIIMMGFALSFVFVPIGNMATATLSNEEMGNASGIFNLLRNIGGSIGISMAATMLVRRMSLHQTRIAGSVPLSGIRVEQHATAMAAYFGRQLGHAQGQPAALAVMYLQMERQAMLWAFVDIFRWVALVAFAAGLMAWLFRRMSARADGSVQLH